MLHYCTLIEKTRNTFYMSQIVALNSQKQNYQDCKENLILKPLYRELGFTAAQSVIAYVCVTTGTSKLELLSSYETFSKLIKQVYGDAGQKYVLDKLVTMQERTH